MSTGRLRLVAWGAVLVLAVILPFFFNAYRVGQFTQAAAYAVAVLGLNLLVGYSGQISLGPRRVLRARRLRDRRSRSTT